MFTNLITRGDGSLITSHLV